MIRRQRRDWRWVAASTALHVVGIALLVRVATVPGALMSWFQDSPRSVDAPRERLLYTPLIRPSGDSARARIDGGDGRKATRDIATATPLRAPLSVPSTLPPAPKVTDT